MIHEKKLSKDSTDFELYKIGGYDFERRTIEEETNITATTHEMWVPISYAVINGRIEHLWDIFEIRLNVARSEQYRFGNRAFDLDFSYQDVWIDIDRSGDSEIEVTTHTWKKYSTYDRTNEGRNDAFRREQNKVDNDKRFQEMNHNIMKDLKTRLIFG